MPAAPAAPTPQQAQQALDDLARRCSDLRATLHRVIVGQSAAVDSLIAALLCRGHVLLVGVPGLAKTLLVRTLAAATGLHFSRIQFTPDLMPSDILGIELIQEDPATGQRSLRFVKGPLFAQLVLADEVNRTPPKTQAALLEAMAEHQVTTAGQTLRLDAPFVVVATQNPIEQEGTYPLPEAQLDRFLFSLWMDYPSVAEEERIVGETPRIHAEQVATVFDRDTLLRCAQLVWEMPASAHVVKYAVAIARASRPGEPGCPEVTKKYVAWGAGPRAGQALVHAAKALAAMSGQPTPSALHVRQAAMAVLRHRIVVNYAAAGENLDSRQIVDRILQHVREPQYP